MKNEEEILCSVENLILDTNLIADILDGIQQELKELKKQLVEDLDNKEDY